MTEDGEPHENNQAERPKRSGLRIRRVAALSIVVAAMPWIGMRLAAQSAIVSQSSVNNIAATDVALVLGAGLTINGQPSDVLSARVEAAMALYNTSKVRKLVMSGDNSRQSYDEVSAMKTLAVQLGAEPNDVLLDYAGFRTLDSCVRIRKVFGQSSVILVSQRFHLPRAIHLCRWAGVEVQGVAADDPRSSRRQRMSAVREVPASAQAWVDAHLFRRQPKFLGPAIDIDNPPAEALLQPSS